MKKSLMTWGPWGADGLYAGRTDHYLEFVGDQRFSTPLVPFPCSLVYLSALATHEVDFGDVTLKVRLNGNPYAEAKITAGNRGVMAEYGDEEYPVGKGDHIGLVCDVSQDCTSEPRVSCFAVLAVYLCEHCDKPMDKDEHGQRKCKDCPE